MSIKHRKSIALLIATLGFAGCENGTASPALVPTAPSSSAPAPPASPANQQPTITNVQVMPSTHGIASRTVFTFYVTATDPDGDPVAVKWDFGDGRAGRGTSVRTMYAEGGQFQPTVTVSDDKGSEAKVGLNVTVGSMTGIWKGSYLYFHFTFDLVQTGTSVQGTYVDEVGEGRLDPAAPINSISDDGTVALRVKQDGFQDFTFRGRMDASGTRVTGYVYGRGYSGDPFVMEKQPR